MFDVMEKAQLFFEQALKLFQELNRSEREAYAYYYLGDVAFDQPNVRGKPRPTFRRLLDIFITF